MKILKANARPLTVFALIHGVIFMAYFANANLNYIPGVSSTGIAEIERQVATSILNGQIPYRDFTTEYPPLALLSFLLPALLFSSQPAYSLAFAAQMLLIDLVVLYLLTAFASRLQMKTWHVLGIYTLLLLAIGPIVAARYDLLPAMLVLAALYAFISNRNKTAWTALALGTATKLFPAIIAPIFAIYLLRKRQYAKMILSGIVFISILAALVLPWVILSSEGFGQFLSYHTERGLHSESSYGSALLVGDTLELTQVRGELSFGSWNIRSPAADNLAAAATYISIVLLLILYALYARRLWKQPEDDGEMATAALMLRYCLLAVLILLLSSKLFSVQFLVWLIPLLPLVWGRWRHIPWIIFMVAAVMTQFIYPYNYLEFEMKTPYLVGMMAGRNFLLVVMAIVLILPIKRRQIA